MTVRTDNSISNPSPNITSRKQVSFSIIMPTYNRKHCIDQAIQSLLSQNYGYFELLIVDDCSTDGTLDHIKATYPAEIEHGKIRLLPIGKVGVSGARNVGLSNAQYDWICYLDTDNIMMPSYFETFKQFIQENSDYECFYAKMRLRSSAKVIGKSFSFFELLQANFIDIGTFVHSKALYRELGGQDVNVSGLEDWDQIIRYTALHEPYFIDAVVLDYNDGIGDRVSNYAKHEDKTKLIMAKNILVHIDYLAKHLYPHDSLKWAFKHLLDLAFDKIRKIFQRALSLVR